MSTCRRRGASTHGAGEASLIERPQPVQPGRLQLLERLGQLRDAVRADQLGLDRVRLALELEHGPGDRLVREVEEDRLAHARRRRQMSSDGQRRAHAITSALR